MTKEEKQLLLKDLCARLPYGVKGFIEGFGTVDLRGYANFIADDIAIEHNGDLSWIEVNHFKLYLRPTSSMTEEEKIYYNTIYVTLKFYEKEIWLEAHHFDYHRLIEKGLALEAPEGMYKTG